MTIEMLAKRLLLLVDDIEEKLPAAQRKEAQQLLQDGKELLEQAQKEISL